MVFRDVKSSHALTSALMVLTAVKPLRLIRTVDKPSVLLVMLFNAVGI